MTGRSLMPSLCVATALTWASPSQANVVGTEMRHFNPTASNLDFVTVQSSETLQPGIYNISFWQHYARNPLPEFEDDGKRTDKAARNWTLDGDLNAGFGLTRSLDLGVNLPFVEHQRVGDDNRRLQFAARGATQVRGSLKWRLLGKADGGVALVGGVAKNLIKDNPFVGTGSGVSLTSEVVADRQVAGVSVGLNVGYRSSGAGESLEDIPVEPFGDQWLYSAAVSRLLPGTEWTVIGELYGSQPVGAVGNSETRARMRAAEALLGAKYQVNTNLAVHTGAATYVDRSSASPDWRIYLGISWADGAPTTHAPVDAEPSPPGHATDESPAMPSNEPFTIPGVEFASASSTVVGPGTVAALRVFAASLKKRGYPPLLIEGHTDSVGSDEANLKLSEDRAAAIKAALAKLGVPAEKLSSKGFGESQPIADNNTYQGRQANRRVQFRLP